MKIRKATKSDKADVAVLFKEMIEFHSANDQIFTLNATGPERYADWFISQILNESALPLVAESDGKIVGFSLSILRKYPAAWQAEDYGEINDIGISKEYRNKGIGTKLVQECVSWLESKGIKRLEVKVAPSNEISSKFWRKLGMIPYLETLYVDIPGSKIR